MGGPAVQPLGQADLADFGAGHGSADHSSDPLVAPAGHSHQRVVVLAEDAVHLLPLLLLQAFLHQTRDFSIPLQQFQCHPVLRVGLRHVTLDQRLDLGQHLPVVGADLGTFGRVDIAVARYCVNRLHEFVHADVLGGDHRHHLDAQRCLQHLRLDVEALLLCYVHHIQRHDDRRGQWQQLRHQVQAALQDRRVHHHDHHVRSLLDDEIAGDDLLGRIGGQTVGARQVH